jgi:hypothetical protein
MRMGRGRGGREGGREDREELMIADANGYRWSVGLYTPSPYRLEPRREGGREGGRERGTTRHVPRLERRCEFMHRFCIGAVGEGKR